MRILTHPFHRAIEWYWLRLFPEHEFLFYKEGEGEECSEDMMMREHPPNHHWIHELPDPATCIAISHTTPWHKIFSEKYRTIHWFHHLPYDGSATINPEVAVYLTEEACNIWHTGAKRVVAYHPISVFEFYGYEGTIPKALMCATMPMSWWGDKKGYGLFKWLLGKSLPYKLVGRGNEQFPECEPEFVTSSLRMLEIYQQYRVYGCTSPQMERSPLEALATGMPVVAIRHEYNTLKEELRGIVHYAETKQDMLLMLRDFLTSSYSVTRSSRQRERINKIFSPGEIRKRWQVAFEGIA